MFSGWNPGEFKIPFRVQIGLEKERQDGLAVIVVRVTFPSVLEPNGLFGLNFVADAQDSFHRAPGTEHNAIGGGQRGFGETSFMAGEDHRWVEFRDKRESSL